MKTTKEMIEVMQAHEHDKKIEVQDGEGEWYGASTPQWDWKNYDYRIKPQPKTIFVNEYEYDDDCIYPSEGYAKNAAIADMADPIRIAVEYREVIK